MEEQLTYNYCCIADNCDAKTVQIKGNENDVHLCTICNEPLKMLGIATSILHKGTQESFSKMNRG